ncbi:uncharacterized protein B0J16DRAFT_366416 [Fusarium flagelliforme]|uniref:Uncharacterized protein n=1 Tax=Fusarium flagelliforme TaxID=2675880 RepID=A0A395MBU5_9HYPO|nr:uncharacterized protein B0J16DRAFT_366416 [Fusarium flagelliforme]KAH7197176.1 hypothetical protein B0J16DRAFT_366416 [Fusarium flagelliforme]RFN44569.1 hypothetical protein FIE12Z_11189 [Fusarium flagelliforme]
MASGQRRTDGGFHPGTPVPTNARHGPGFQPLVDLSGHANPTLPHMGNYMPYNVAYSDYAPMNEFRNHQQARTNSFSQHSEQTAEAQMSAFERFSARINPFTSTTGNRPDNQQYEHLVDQIKRCQSQLEEATYHRQELESENLTLKQQLKESDSRLAKALEERDEYKRISDGNDWTGSVKVSDDDVQDKWKQLDYNIRSFAKALAKCPVTPPTTDLAKERFSIIASHWMDLLGDQDYREWTIHAYLWVVVQNVVFIGSGKIWGGDHVWGFKRLREVLLEHAFKNHRFGLPGPSIRHIARWSIQGASLLGHLSRRDPERLKRVVRRELDQVKDFCDIVLSKSNVDFLQGMLDIFENALELDEIFMKSKAVFAIRTCTPAKQEQSRFDANMMEALAYSETLSSQTIVDFNVSPVLVKRGNADGCKYRNKMVLCKGSVVCH